MDPRLFQPGIMGLEQDLAARPRRYRNERLKAWYEARNA